MPKYMIERNMPGAGSLSREDLAGIADRSCRALDEIGPQIQWVESFVTADKIYSVYIARDQRLVREHAYRSKAMRLKRPTSHWPCPVKHSTKYPKIFTAA
jgi:hypothetical protein